MGVRCILDLIELRIGLKRGVVPGCSWEWHTLLHGVQGTAIQTFLVATQAWALGRHAACNGPL